MKSKITLEEIEAVLLNSKKANKGRFVHGMNASIGRLDRWIEYNRNHSQNHINETMRTDYKYLRECLNQLT